jgi:hypothetical protein
MRDGIYFDNLKLNGLDVLMFSLLLLIFLQGSSSSLGLLGGLGLLGTARCCVILSTVVLCFLCIVCKHLTCGFVIFPDGKVQTLWIH